MKINISFTIIEKDMKTTPRITSQLYPINFFCCGRPDHFIPDPATNRYQYCRSCNWFFKADLFISDDVAFEWVHNEIKKKKE